MIAEVGLSPSGFDPERPNGFSLESAVEFHLQPEETRKICSNIVSRALFVSPMRRTLRLSLLLVMTGIGGCTTQVPPSAPSQPAPQSPPAAPQSSPVAPPQSSTPERFFTQTGLASFYGSAHQGKTTAGGKSFDQHDFTAAHRTLPFGTVVRVTDLANGRTVKVEITDRGPHISGRVIDLSSAAARALDMEKSGITRVRLEAFRADQAGRE
jgi:rare lipoprotein A